MKHGALLISNLLYKWYTGCVIKIQTNFNLNSLHIVPPPNVTLGDWVSLMLLVNSHKLKMIATSTPGRKYNQRAAIIEGLGAGRSPTDAVDTRSTGGMTTCSPTIPRMSPLLPEQNVRPMFTCWVLCPVRMSCHRISLKIRKRSLKKYMWTFWRSEAVDGNCCVWKAICFSAGRCTGSHEPFDPKLALR